MFKSSNNFNYAKEALNFLLQYYYVLSERQRAQLLWSRCINTKGLIGANIPCDLFMEHLNRRLKKIIRIMGPNVTPKALQKGAKAIAPVQHVRHLFEQQTSKCVHSDHHSIPPFAKNFHAILKVLLDEQVFVPLRIRRHKKINLTCTLMEKYSASELHKRVQSSIERFHRS